MLGLFYPMLYLCSALLRIASPCKSKLMASIKLILRVDKIGKDGEAPLYIRIIKDRKTKLISLDAKLKPIHWDEEKQVVRKSNKNSARINALISQKVADAKGEVADLERSKRPTTARGLKEAIKGKNPENFFEYCEARCEKLKNLIAPSSYRNYKQYVKKFKTFLGDNEIFFQDITVTTLNDYIKYCSEVLKNGNTTIHYSLNILAIMYKDAIREDIVSAMYYPFDKISVKKNKGKRLYLNTEQLQQLEDLEPTQVGTACFFKDMFLVAVYGGGLRYSDVAELQWENYDSETKKITKIINKTKRQHSFKIGDKAANIINKYKTATSKPEDFIFPLIRNSALYWKDRFYKQKEITRTNNLSTLHLRKMGEEMKLPFPLTFHLARHTFATRVLNKGMRIEHVSKILDHSDIGITQIYAKIISEELDNAVDKFVN